MRHNKYRGRACGSGGDDLGNLFASSYLQKNNTPLTQLRSSNYDDIQEIRIGIPESSGVREQEMTKFETGKIRANSIRDGGRGILQHRSTYGTQGIKV